MSWNEISDGQPGLALPAMQNWRHAGRFNGDMIPLATDGSTLTTGLLNLGTSSAPWANAYIAAGGSVYVGASPLSGGGGGSSIEVYEQQTHLNKIGYDYPLSNPQVLNESFTDDSAMLITLGKTHDAASTTIYLDRDASTISALNTTTGWTAVTGTVVANVTAGQSVNGSSVKITVTGTNTSYLIASSFTAFSLIDKDFKAWLYPNTVANITGAIIRLYSAATTTGYAEWQIPAASITASTLNSIMLDMDSPDTTGADYLRSSIIFS